MLINYFGFNFNLGKNTQSFINYLITIGQKMVDGSPENQVININLNSSKKEIYISDDGDFIKGLVLKTQDKKKTPTKQSDGQIGVLHVNGQMFHFNYFVYHKISQKGLYAWNSHSMGISKFGDLLRKLSDEYSRTNYAGSIDFHFKQVTRKSSLKKVKSIFRSLQEAEFEATAEQAKKMKLFSTSLEHAKFQLKFKDEEKYLEAIAAEMQKQVDEGIATPTKVTGTTTDGKKAYVNFGNSRKGAVSYGCIEYDDAVDLLNGLNLDNISTCAIFEDLKNCFLKEGETLIYA